jgi:hypothetical protein
MYQVIVAYSYILNHGVQNLIECSSKAIRLVCNRRSFQMLDLFRMYQVIIAYSYILNHGVPNLIGCRSKAIRLVCNRRSFQIWDLFRIYQVLLAYYIGASTYRCSSTLWDLPVNPGDLCVTRQVFKCGKFRMYQQRNQFFLNCGLI